MRQPEYNFRDLLLQMMLPLQSQEAHGMDRCVTQLCCADRGIVCWMTKKNSPGPIDVFVKLEATCMQAGLGRSASLYSKQALGHQ